MARGVARTLEERLAPIDEKVADLKSKLANLESERQKLIESDRAAKLQKVLDVAEKKGLSVDDIISKITE